MSFYARMRAPVILHGCRRSQNSKHYYSASPALIPASHQKVLNIFSQLFAVWHTLCYPNMEVRRFALRELLTLSPLVQALLATLLTWLVTALGAALVLLTRKRRPLLMDALLAFGAGVMLASSYFSLLAPGIELAAELRQAPWLAAAAGFLCGGVLLLLANHILSQRMPSFLVAADSRRRSILLISSITLHNIPEGLAIGVSFGALSAMPTPSALTAAWMLAIGIALQNFPEGAAVSLPLRRDGMSRGLAFFFGQLSGAVEPLAAVLGCLLAVRVRTLLPFALTFAAGAMVLVVIAELVPESQRSRRPALMTLATMAGFTLMMILDVALG